jgi:hypothetical protein
MKLLAILAAACMAAAVGGCSEALPGTTRYLGAVDYDRAFTTARETLVANNFSVASADRETGKIVARPRSVDLPGERLLGSSPARQVAQMRLRREDGQVAAFASVAVQRLGDETVIVQPRENYDTVPDETPAETWGATTAEQNATWVTQSYDHALERQLLADLFRRLGPEGPIVGEPTAPQPAAPVEPTTAPASSDE